MTDHDAGYVQALMDMQVAIRTMVKDLSPSPEDQIELLGAVSFLDILIKTKMNPERDENRDLRDGTGLARRPCVSTFGSL